MQAVNQGVRWVQLEVNTDMRAQSGELVTNSDEPQFSGQTQ